jgi:glycerol-3-phosphate O-acyltransferase|tara:strand:- start:287 stop:2644 length:2358 start_codon:yes stop_codon:yes gene_type:complete
MRVLFGLYYRVIRWLTQPSLSGQLDLDPDSEVVYVQSQRVLSDLFILDHAIRGSDYPSPLSPLELGDWRLTRRTFALRRPVAGRMTMQTYSERMLSLVDAPDSVKRNIVIVPFTVFWGRSLAPKGSWLHALTSESGELSGRFKRTVSLLINRHDIHVRCGDPIALAEITNLSKGRDIAIRRTARYLRVKHRQQREATLGPEFTHRNALIETLVVSDQVRTTMRELELTGQSTQKLERLARRHAKSIAANMSHGKIRVFLSLLTWFWNRLYSGVNVGDVATLAQSSDTHTLVYVPSHRSHVDYLVLSYTLYLQGLMIPHIAAGDNLNMPLVGRFLRGGGAFFMRRSFREDPLYASVFAEYVYQLARRGHCLEFFPEGGRSRTGRLLPAKFGLLKMCVDSQQRGLPKPLAFVPVYFGYEIVLEGSSYLSELRGADKKRESPLDILRSLKLIRKNFGELHVNFGTPIKLDEWLEQYQDSDSDDAQLLPRLGNDLMQAINREASANPINLVASAILTADKQAMPEQQLLVQLQHHQQLIRDLGDDQLLTDPSVSPTQLIQSAENLGWLHRETQPFGDVLSLQPVNAVMLTWYRNNIMHLLALPSLIACLIVNRRRGISLERLKSGIDVIYPYIAEELSTHQTANTEATLTSMSRLGLVRREADTILPAAQHSEQRLPLLQLSKLVNETLERMYIVLSLAHHGQYTRESLCQRSQLAAQQMARLHGINAPEFFDQGLFDRFIDALLANQHLQTDDAQLLVTNSTIAETLHNARAVIDDKIRFALTPLLNG